MSIILIEDDTIHAKLIRRALERAGYGDNIVYLADGEQAIVYFFSNDKRRCLQSPKLILLDINLPKVSGIEVLRRIKGDERLRTIPVVMLTTSNNRTDMERCFKYSANSYVSKPLDFSEFMAKMKSIAMYWLEINDTPEE